MAKNVKLTKEERLVIKARRAEEKKIRQEAKGAQNRFNLRRSAVKKVLAAVRADNELALEVGDYDVSSSKLVKLVSKKAKNKEWMREARAGLTDHAAEVATALESLDQIMSAVAIEEAAKLSRAADKATKRVRKLNGAPAKPASERDAIVEAANAA